MILALLRMLLVKWTAPFPGRYYSYTLIVSLVSYKKQSYFYSKYISVFCVAIKL